MDNNHTLHVLDESDDVAVVVVAADGPVPVGHKVALRDIHQGAPVHKYGHIIGYATQDIQRCQTVQGAPEYYEVTYNFRGTQHTAVGVFGEHGVAAHIAIVLLGDVAAAAQVRTADHGEQGGAQFIAGGRSRQIGGAVGVEGVLAVGAGDGALLPNIDSGLDGMWFIGACQRSSQAGGEWIGR